MSDIICITNLQVQAQYSTCTVKFHLIKLAYFRYQSITQFLAVMTSKAAISSMMSDIMLGRSIRRERRWDITSDKQLVYCIVVAPTFPDVNILSLSIFMITSTEEGEDFTIAKIIFVPTFHAFRCFREPARYKGVIDIIQ